MLAERASSAGGSAVDEPADLRPLDIGSGTTMPMGPGHPTSFDPTWIDFGHHAGRTIDELATLDPDYLRWLARHPSGFRYRAAIARVLASAVPHAGDWER
jgi:hypothetical protein